MLKLWMTQHQALRTGARKQSVVDAERLFSPDLEKFMIDKGYRFEATYIRTIWNWRRAGDEQGLKEDKDQSITMPYTT